MWRGASCSFDYKEKSRHAEHGEVAILTGRYSCFEAWLGTVCSGRKKRESMETKGPGFAGADGRPVERAKK
jgi:hypothetical protein